MTSAPPDSLDVFDPRHLDDPNRLYDLLRSTAPVHRVGETNFYLVSSWDLVTEAVSRTDDFSSNLTAALVRGPDGTSSVFEMDVLGSAMHVLATADDPAHAAQRRIVAPAVGQRLKAIEPMVTELVEQLWSENLRDGRIEWVSGMADRLPLAVVARLLGLPDEDLPQLLGWAYDSTEMLSGLVESDRMGQLTTSAVELAGYLYSSLQSARDEPRDDVTGVLASAVDAGEIAPEVAVLILVQLVGAGGESTAALTANAARMLAADAELQDRLRAEPALIGNFLEEALRLESPFRAHHRHVTTDTSLGGVDLRADSHLMLMWGAANRDPANFAEPDRIDLDRKGSRAHVAFGKGAHFCIGAALARMEAHAAIAALLENSSRVSLIHSDEPRWVPSIMVRRHEYLPLRIS
ncbi:cytochrome P450 [Aldersonia kunmingensis]|uniref:cytochrome P450 n=1 Tax=Aldersonia kunmingensis TaxID=408066 RepID=UPI000833B630|nr:cytochrome P450 [Aldersonia kunmingensis]